MSVRTIPCPGDMLCCFEDCDEPTAVAVVDHSRHDRTHEGDGMVTSFGACAICWGGVAACAGHVAEVVDAVTCRPSVGSAGPEVG